MAVEGAAMTAPHSRSRSRSPAKRDGDDVDDAVNARGTSPARDSRERGEQDGRAQRDAPGPREDAAAPQKQAEEPVTVTQALDKIGAHLPVNQHADAIADLVRSNPVTVIIGETGSGKTTQISQILLDHGLVPENTRIGVTQPRRVAAVSVARRVAEERGGHVGEEVGYAVRFEEATSPSTRIKYLTDGTLLRKVMDDPQLRQYSVVVLDEAHERSLNTDILFGVLKWLTQHREGFRLVITSATLDGEKFSRFFLQCPVLTIPGRVFPVEVLHVAEGPKRYQDAAVECAVDIHCRQPPGDILVFLTGQGEIEDACRKINRAIQDLPEGSCGALMVIPLYAALPLELQARVFLKPPPDVRRCIVATNIAETSVTVDGVVYVVDPGMSKQKDYDPKSGMDSLEVRPISRVQATQRAGRAGRTRPGKCFRLYTTKFFEREMPEVAAPEIQRTSLAGAVLYLKSLPLGIDVLRFDFLDPPDRGQLEDALRQLYALGAIGDNGDITPLGRKMSAVPLEPSVSRALVAAKELGCMREMLTVAAMLSAESIFSGNRGPDIGQRDGGRQGQGTPSSSSRGREILKRLVAEKAGDHVLLLRVWEVWARSNYDKGMVRDLGLDSRGMRFARDVRRQLAQLVGEDGAGLERGAAGRPLEVGAGPGRGSQASARGAARGDTQEAVSTSAAYSDRVRELRQALCLGYANKIARRMPAHNGYRTMNVAGQLAQIHPNSINLLEDADGLLPEWVVYHEFVRTSRSFLSTVCPVEHEWVAPLLPRLRDVDVGKLSGGSLVAEGGIGNTAAPASKDEGKVANGDGQVAAASKLDDKALSAAKARYEARKKMRGK